MLSSDCLDRDAILCIFKDRLVGKVKALVTGVDNSIHLVFREFTRKEYISGGGGNIKNYLGPFDIKLQSLDLDGSLLPPKVIIGVKILYKQGKKNVPADPKKLTEGIYSGTYDSIQYYH